MDKLFISHSKFTKKTLVVPFVQTLSALHIPYWFDRKDLVCGDSIYTNIERGISEASYCVAFVDQVYLEREWTKKELEMFYKREKELGKDLIIPIYCGLTKEVVYEYFPWIEGRAFEKTINSTEYNIGEQETILCRVLGKILVHEGALTDISLIYKIPDLKSCAEFTKLLRTILDKGFFNSDNVQLSCIELCNIEGVLYAIAENTEFQIDDLCVSCHLFSGYVKNLLWTSSEMISYDFYLTLKRSIYYLARSLLVFLDVQ